jgi:hypothetical protein
MNEITGVIAHKGDIWTNDGGTFTKQELVIAITSGDFTNVAVLEAIQDKVSLLKDYDIGDQVKCTFFFNGRNQAYNGRYYNSLKINTIDLLAKAEGFTAPAPEPAIPPPMPELGEESEDIPF